MAMGTKGNTPSKSNREVRGGDNAAGRDDPAVDNPVGSVPPQDEVAMVSRNADGSDAQHNTTVRVLTPEEARKADRAQLDIIEK